MAVSEQLRLRDPAGDFRRIAAVRPDHGIKPGAIGIILPLVATLPMDPTLKLLYTFFVFIWSFMGYYYSPLHLCQLLTIKYMGCATWPVYKEHLKIIPWLFVSSYLLFYLYQWILL